mgnify:CR=1 FL=1
MKICIENEISNWITKNYSSSDINEYIRIYWSANTVDAELPESYVAYGSGKPGKIVQTFA